MSIKLTFHGHATFSLDIDGTHVVVDPFFAPNNPSATKSAADVAADYILQTHGHGDHIADTVSLAKRTGALVIANFEIVNWLSAKGVTRLHGQHLGGGFKHPDPLGYVKMTTAFHGSGLPDGSYGGMPAGFLLNIQGKKIYFTGDTALFSDMALYATGGLDLVIMPIGDNYTMGPDDALLALDYLKPKAVIPCHYNTWPPITQDVQAWANRVRKETHTEPVILNAEESYIL